MIIFDLSPVRDEINKKLWQIHIHKFTFKLYLQFRTVNVLSLTQSLSELLQDIKGSSSKWINERKFVKGRFSWQEGYGAFSYSKPEIPRISDYIDNQKVHHCRKTFSEEYIEMLNEFGVEYDGRYVFAPVEIYYIVLTALCEPDGILSTDIKSLWDNDVLVMH